jgi:transposase-like protein
VHPVGSAHAELTQQPNQAFSRNDCETARPAKPPDPWFDALYRTGRLLPAAWHRTDRYANNGIECDHGRLEARLQPMRGLKQDRSARVIVAGHAFVQNLRRGHCELAVEEPTNRRLAVAFQELALAI